MAEVTLIASTHFDPEAWSVFRRIGWSPNNGDDARPAGTSGDGQDLAEFAGRACYQSWDRPNAATATNKGYIDHIVEVEHTSVLEHASATLYFEDVSRSFTHELVRHRHLSYCLAGDTRVYLDRARRGTGTSKGGGHGQSQTRTLEQLWEMWQDRRRTYVKVMTIRTTTDNGVVTHGHVRRVIQSGVKPVYRVVTAAGYVINSTLLHRYQRADGSFSALEDLSVGDEIMANGVGLTEEGRARLREQKLGGKNPAWKGGLSSWSNGRTAANILYPDTGPCEMCADTRRVERHHIDSDQFNNERSNIAMLCPPCHKARHTGTPPLLTHPTRIVSIEYVGEEMTYDLEMAGEFKRFVANGLVVHNSQLSQRYVSMSYAKPVVPPAIQTPDVPNQSLSMEDIVRSSFSRDLAAYNVLVEELVNAKVPRKKAREAARCVLPNSTPTSIVVTGNYRAWSWFLTKRDHGAADAEMQEIAGQVRKILREVAPNVFNHYGRDQPVVDPA